MSQGSFIVLMLIMWAVVATFYTVIFHVNSGPEQKTMETKESTPAHPGESPKEGHKLPHAA